MPLIKYFGFVGSALVLLLIGSGWCFPQPRSEPPKPPDSVIDRPAIRIASAERLPERVIIDTSLPTIVSPPSVLEFAERWPEATVADVNPVPKPATPAPVSDISTKQNFAKRERSKKVAVHRPAPKANIEPSSNGKVPPTTSAVTRSSLLDIVKEGFGQTQAKLMAGLEPLTAYISKPRAEMR
jgi:hypothetical protein